MKKYLAVYDPIGQRIGNNLDFLFAKKCLEIGYNSYYLDLNIYWCRWEVKNGFYYEDKQIYAVDDMFKDYIKLREMGYELFIVTAGWGLGSLDNNYFYKVIYDKFRDSEDVVYDCGEFYEDYVEKATFVNFAGEKEKLLLDTYNNIINIKKRLIGDKLIIGATARNKKILQANSLTSYLFQECYWEEGDKLAWFYGQFSITHFFSSLWYKSHSKKLDSLGVSLRILYQGDGNKWIWSQPYTWANCIMNKIHFKNWNLQEWFENRLLMRFPEKNK